MSSSSQARSYREAAERWRANDLDPDTRAEVDALLASGDDALADRFGARLQFGTAGLRGELGAGPNRMNRALLRRSPDWVLRVASMARMPTTQALPLRRAVLRPLERRVRVGGATEPAASLSALRTRWTPVRASLSAGVWWRRAVRFRDAGYGARVRDGTFRQTAGQIADSVSSSSRTASELKAPARRRPR
jgi:hypothetical protein